MTWQRRSLERDRLLRELGTESGRELLRIVCAHASPARQFEGWGDVRGHLQDVGLRGAAADGVIRAILHSRRASPLPPWSEGMLYLCFGALVGIHRRKSRWDRDPEALWTNLQVCFLEVVHRIDLKARPERVGQKILNDTTHHLHDHYAAEWRRARREIATDPEDLLAFADPRPGIDLDGIDLRRVQRSEVTRLRSLRVRGRISDVDFFLQVGTRIYGRDLAECAAAVGLHYEAARKRCQRMGARIGPNRRR